MATAITTTPQDITGDFDLVIRGTSDSPVAVQKSLGTGTTNWVGLHTGNAGEQPKFVKNTGTNAFRLAATVANVTVEYQQ
jgi:hypothetical protein